MADQLTIARVGVRRVQVRSASADAEDLVQVVCNAADYAIDLQIEPEYESAVISLVGQVGRRTGPGEPLGNVGVRLMVRNRLLAETRANDQGEFCLGSRIHNGLKLLVDIEGAGLRVGIPLDRLTARFRL